MNARDAEFTLFTRCVAVARDATLFALNQCEANVFRLAAMVVQHQFPREATSLMRASEYYFSEHPNEKLAPGDVVRNGWILNLPRLHDMLCRQLNQRQSHAS